MVSRADFLQLWLWSELPVHLLDQDWSYLQVQHHLLGCFHLETWSRVGNVLAFDGLDKACIIICSDNNRARFGPIPETEIAQKSCFSSGRKSHRRWGLPELLGADRCTLVHLQRNGIGIAYMQEMIPAVSTTMYLAVIFVKIANVFVQDSFIVWLIFNSRRPCDFPEYVGTSFHIRLVKLTKTGRQRQL